MDRLDALLWPAVDEGTWPRPDGATLPAAMTRAIAFSSTDCAQPPDRTTRWLRLTGGRWPRGGTWPPRRRWAERWAPPF